MRRAGRMGRVATLAGALLLSVPGDAVSQAGSTQERAAVRASVDPELEEYLRALQLLGRVAPRSWSIRALSPAEVAELAPADSVAHPWAARWDFSPAAEPVDHGWIVPGAEAVYNTSFPYGFNDGPLWAGRGLTGSVSGGGWARAGPVWLTAAPLAFWTENRGFGPDEGTADWRVIGLDRPERFGSGGVARLDPGASSVRLELRPVAVGAATGAQVWGPARDLPLILGRNAPGFLHLFVGTSRPADVGIGELHARVVAGRLEQSDFAPESADSVRLATGWVVSFRPRGLEALEIGATRFFHQPWGGGPGSDELRRIFEWFLKFGLEGGGDEGTENQLASAFARLLLAGTEVYVEFAREDHSGNLRDFLGEPDHFGALTVGVARAWEAGGAVRVFRGEFLEARPDREDLGRGSRRFYTHTQLRQGHTHRGQILGSPAAVGGAALSLRLDEYSPAGRRGLYLRRETIADAQIARSRQIDPGTGDDVLWALGADLTRFRARSTLRLGGAVVANLNRRFGGDRWGVRLSAGIDGLW